MKLVAPTIGSRGDVQPFVALAQGLKRARHGIDVAISLIEETLGTVDNRAELATRHL